MDMTEGMGTSGYTEWMTPKWLFDALLEEFGNFDLDPCGCRGSYVSENVGMEFYLPENDGLRERWFGQVFVNPPYGDAVPAWLKKGIVDIANPDRLVKRIVYLLAMRADTEWWHELVLPYAKEISVLNGRVAFVPKDGRKVSSPAFPSCLVIMESRTHRVWKDPQFTVFKRPLTTFKHKK